MTSRRAFGRALRRAQWEGFLRALRRSWLIWAFAAAALVLYVVLERVAPMH